MRHYLEYILLLFAGFLFRCFPLKIGLMIGRFLGRFVFEIDIEHRQIALKNIQLAKGLILYGDKEQRHKEDNIANINIEANRHSALSVVKKVYLGLGMSMAEFFYIPRVNKDYIERFITIEGKENLDSAMLQGRGVIMVFGHIGSWELNNAIYGILGYPTVAVAFQQNNRMTDKIINRYRQYHGVKVVYDDTPYQDLVAILKSGCILALVSDQDAGSRGVFVDFLGRPASTAKGPAILAMRTGAPLMINMLIRESNGMHRLIFKGPLEISNTGNFKKDVLINTKLWSDVIEDCVKAYPEQWFWLHRRWKTQRGEL